MTKNSAATPRLSDAQRRVLRAVGNGESPYSRDARTRKVLTDRGLIEYDRATGYRLTDLGREIDPTDVSVHAD